MIQKLDKYGSTSVDNANVVILDKNGNVKKIAAASGTVTSILTASPITGGPITSSGTIGITQATTSTDGYLSSTDWNTFNSKFNLPSLTSGSVLFSNGTTIAQKNSNFFWDDVNNRLGVGTNAPTTTLHIKNPSGGQIAVFGNDSTNSRILIGYGAGGGHLLELGSFSGYSGIQNVVTNGKLVLQGTNGGNLLVGTTTDNGGKLQIKAPGALSTDIALKVRNSADTVDLMTLDGLGRINIKSNGFTGTMSLAQTANSTSVISGGPASENITFGPSNRIFVNAQQVGISYLYNLGTIQCVGLGGTAGNSLSLTSGGFVASGSLIQNHLKITSSVGLQNIGPTFNALNIEPTINNTTTSAAIVRGLYYSPILTSLTGTTHRAIETTTGDVIFGSTSGNVGINTTTPTSKLQIVGSGNTSSTTSLKVQNTASVDVLTVRDDMYVTVKNTNNATCFEIVGVNTDARMLFTPSGGTSNIVLKSQGSTLTLSTTANSYADIRQSYAIQHLRIGASAGNYGGNLYSYVGNASNGFYWNTINTAATEVTKMLLTTGGNLLINTIVDNGGKLQIKAPGALSTDIAIRVRNSADTFDIIRANGVGDVFLGLGAGNVSTGTQNVFIGLQSGLVNTTASYNTAVGGETLKATTGGYNTAIGRASLKTNSTGTLNTAMGVSSLELNLGGNNNTAIGVGALQNNTSGSNNTAIGIQTPIPAEQNTTGSNNIFIGFNAVGVSKTESNRTWIGNSTTTSTWLGGNLLLGTTTDIASSKLTVESTTQGFLPPRMTNAQRIAIATPAVGLMVYCTDVVEGLYINKSTGWTYIG